MFTNEYKLINGHKVFCDTARNDDYKIEGFEALFGAEEKHFWFITRKEFILQHIKSAIKKDAKILEVGAGTGNVTRCLQNNGYKNMCVGEMHLDALEYAKHYGIKDRYCFDLLNTPFENEFDCIMAFDVIEHIEDDNLAIKNIAKSLIGGGGRHFGSYRSCTFMVVECS